MASRKAVLIAAASIAIVVVALLPVTARPDNHVVGEQKFWSGPDVYVVGDTDGWRLGVNYHNWALANNGLPVGSTLHFMYDRTSHNVVQVAEDDYDNCIVPNNAGTWNSGDDFLALGNAGTFFFICGMGNHCSQGMKLSITAI